MRKFLLGILVGVLVCGLVAALGFGVFVSMAAFRDRGPTVKDSSTLVLSLAGDIEELPEAGFGFPVPGMDDADSLAVLDFRQMIRAAARDNRIKALMLRPRRPGIGWGRLMELRTAIQEFKKSGKPVYAYLSFPSAVDYMLASAADKIYVTHDDVLDVKGLRLEATFFKGTLDKVGVALETETAGKYKDAGTPYTRTDLSPESREVYNALLDERWESMVQVIAEGRKKSATDVKAAIDAGPWSATKALQLGMVDGVLHIDEVEKQLASAIKQDKLTKIEDSSYWRSRTTFGPRGKRIALLVGQGLIARGEDNYSNQNMLSESMIKNIRRVRDDDRVAGVVFRVNSGGGDAVASEEILREMKLLSQKKPLVISFSDVAASGGYYVACTGDPIVAYPETITGSIGVIYSKPYLKGMYDKIGVTKDIMTRGKNAIYDSDYVSLEAGGREKLKEFIGEIYGNFLNRVATARKRTPEQIHEIAQGRVWTGRQAKANGLVDELGGIDKALEVLKAKGKLDKDLPVVLYPPKSNLFAKLFGPKDEEEAMARMMERYLGVRMPSRLETGFQYRMPVMLEIK